MILNMLSTFALIFSVFINVCFIIRIHDHDAEFYLDISDPDNVKPILKFDIDEVENKPFFIVKVLKEKPEDTSQ